MGMSFILYFLKWFLRIACWRSPEFAKRFREKNLIAQFKIADDSDGRYIIIKDGKITSKAGFNPDAQVSIIFKDQRTAKELLMPPIDHQKKIDAIKNFNLMMIGAEEEANWFAEVVLEAGRIGWRWGTDVGHGEVRYTNHTNGGPVFVYVKDQKIVRVTPIDFTDDDAGTWTIEARGRKFSPPRKTSLAPHGLASKSLIYSKDRLLYPMKRVDFDPDGARNCDQRGISGYERISWDEALDIVTSEIKRVNREHGPGAILAARSSHHTWGNVGYYISAYVRFTNIIGATTTMLNPDSWEGWYWGAMHHYGHSMRNGAAEIYGQVEDCLKECELIVYWASDPEVTNGVYGSFEGTIRR